MEISQDSFQALIINVGDSVVTKNYRIFERYDLITKEGCDCYCILSSQYRQVKPFILTIMEVHFMSTRLIILFLETYNIIIDCTGASSLCHIAYKLLLKDKYYI